MPNKYIMEYCPGHPQATRNGYAYQHRRVMSDHLDRALSRDEHVHHVDGNRHNNAINNLQVVTAEEHRALHPRIHREKQPPKAGRIAMGRRGITVSYSVKGEHEDYLRERARIEGRSLSNTLRRILEAVMRAEPLQQAEPGPGQPETP